MEAYCTGNSAQFGNICTEISAHFFADTTYDVILHFSNFFKIVIKIAKSEVGYGTLRDFRLILAF